MKLYKSPFDNPKYSEYFFKSIDSHIQYFGMTLKLYRSIDDESDTEYSFYQQTVTKRRVYQPAESISGIVNFSRKDGIPRLTNSKGIFTESNNFIDAWFKSDDRVKLYDLIGIEYNIIAEKTELDKSIRYNKHEVLLEVGQLKDYGMKFTNLITYQLTLARTQDISELIKIHSFGAGGFGGGSTFGGGTSS